MRVVSTQHRLAHVKHAHSGKICVPNTHTGLESGQQAAALRDLPRLMRPYAAHGRLRRRTRRFAIMMHAYIHKEAGAGRLVA